MRKSSEFPNLSKLLKNMVHVFRNFRPEVNIRSSHNLSQRLSQLDLFDQTIKVQIFSIFESHIWVVQQCVLSIVGSLSQVRLIKLLDSTFLSSKAFKEVHSCLTIHQTEATQEIKTSVLAFFRRKFFSAHVPGVFQL